MKITKKELPMIMHGVLVVALFCLLIVSVVVLLNNNSVAWFSQNKKVDANGMSVSLKDFGITAKYYSKSNKQGVQTEYAEITSWAHLFEGLVPGDTVTIKAEYTSTDDQPCNLKVLFTAQNETPLTKTSADGTTAYYYFGSQLMITTVSTKIGDGAATTTTLTPNKFLVTPPENKVYFTAEATPNDIELANLEIANGTSTLEFTIQFVNYPDINQNDYQNFGAEGNSTQGESCAWQLVGTVE